jgi:hypothetical protein
MADPRIILIVSVIAVFIYSIVMWILYHNDIWFFKRVEIAPEDETIFHYPYGKNAFQLDEPSDACKTLSGFIDDYNEKLKAGDKTGADDIYNINIKPIITSTDPAKSCKINRKLGDDGKCIDIYGKSIDCHASTCGITAPSTT